MKCLFLGCLLAAAALGADNYAETYANLKKRIPGDKMEAHLAAWRKAEPNNPDAWILSGNWFFEKAQPGIEINTAPPGKDDFAVTDSKTGKVVGHIGEGSRDPARVRIATEFLREALKRWPHRLDIHAGLAHIFETIGAWEDELAALRGLAGAAHNHAGKLRWCHDEPLKEPEVKFVVGKLHSYAAHQFEKETPETDARFGEIARLIAATFPSSAIGHNDLAVYHGLSKNWREAQKALEAAAKAEPGDALVWLNLAENSARLGDSTRARSAYEKVIALDSDPGLVDQAKAAIGKLSRKTAKPAK